MHRRGEEIIADGFSHVVELRNVMGGIPRKITNIANEFIDNLDFELYEDIPWWQRLLHWHGNECRVSIIDGELPGLGMYVFFKEEAAAELCHNEFNKPTRIKNELETNGFTLRRVE